MAFSQFSEVRLGAGQIHAHGPVSAFPPSFKVAGFVFAVVQGDVVAGGPGRVGTTAWEGRADAGELAPGDALGMGVLLLVDPGATAGVQTLTWSEAVRVE